VLGQVPSGEPQMYRAAVIAGGIFAALGVCDVAVTVGSWSFAQAQNIVTPAAARENAAVERTSKGDRLPLVRNAGESKVITTVEVVGLDAATVV
jgi:hypothetical protein